MRFKPATWYPISLALAALNLAGAGLAIGQGEPWHATIHVSLTAAFWLWAQRLRLGLGPGQVQGQSELASRLDALEFEMNKLRQELAETQERLDFAERLLAQVREVPRVERGRGEGKD